MLRHPPQRLELVLDDLAQAELLGHGDLRRQQARRLDLAVEQRLEPRAEAAGVDGLDVLERQIFLQPVGHVEMAAGAHADRDRTSFRSSGLRILESGRTKIAHGDSRSLR